MADPFDCELLRLVDNPARIIQLENQAGDKYSLPFWDYVNAIGIRLRVHYPDYSPYFQIHLASYFFPAAAPQNALDPTMLPHQPDEPLKIDGKAAGDFPAMHLYYRNPLLPPPPTPPADAKALVVCQHLPQIHMGTTALRAGCLTQLLQTAPNPNMQIVFEITPA